MQGHMPREGDIRVWHAGEQRWSLSMRGDSERDFVYSQWPRMSAEIYKHGEWLPFTEEWAYREKHFVPDNVEVKIIDR
jgi:hypothetical protein